jgi:hypothetical protein
MTTKKITTIKKKLLKQKGQKIIWSDSWTYMRTVVDMLHEPFVILDKELRIIAANECFYQKFKMTTMQTEGKLLYNLGHKEWDIPELRELLEIILPKDTFFKGFELVQDFANLGQKVLLLNAREIHLNQKQNQLKPERIILLAMQDITELTTIAHSLSVQSSVNKKEITSLNNIVKDLKATSVELTEIIKSLSGFT